MKTDPLTEKLFYGVTPKLFSDSFGEYFIYFAYPIGLQYSEKGKRLTVFFNPQLHPRPWSWLFPRLLRSLTYKETLIVDMESPAVWDNSDQLPETPDVTIETRIREALKKWNPEIYRVSPLASTPPSDPLTQKKIKTTRK